MKYISNLFNTGWLIAFNISTNKFTFDVWNLGDVTRHHIKHMKVSVSGRHDNLHAVRRELCPRDGETLQVNGLNEGVQFTINLQGTMH